MLQSLLNHNVWCLLFVVVAVVAASTVLCSLGWEVGLAEPTCNGCDGDGLVSAGIATNQLLCQGSLEVLYRFVW